MQKLLILSIILLVLLGGLRAQPPSPTGLPNNIFNGWYQYPGYLQVGNLSFYLKDTSGSKPTGPTMRYWQHAGVDSTFWYWDMTKWQKISVGSGNGGNSSLDSIAGGPFVTENIHVGFDPGTNLTAADVIRKVWYGTKPLATLTNSTTFELTSASTISQTLNWGATRQVGATTLSTIVVAGVSQSFSQPSAGATVSGTQIVSVPTNVTTTYTNTVTAADGQTAIATITDNFLGKKYYGLLADTTGITVGGLNATIITLTNSFASARALSVNTGAITGTKFWCYAFPATLGDLSNLTFNAIPALDAMNKITISITNASGHAQNYLVYYNKQGQTTSSDVTAQ